MFVLELLAIGLGDLRGHGDHRYLDYRIVSLLNRRTLLFGHSGRHDESNAGFNEILGNIRDGEGEMSVKAATQVGVYGGCVAVEFGLGKSEACVSGTG